MPCEACNVQFTVFRRKRCCFACKRFYCNNCLSASSPAGSPVGPLCARCSVFAKRPLLRVDLQQLKPKDLIFYLQSKHISTAGCVEKDELVGLVLNHVQQSDLTPPATGASSHEGAPRDFESAHSFEALKQSCQNFFSNLSEKVNESFSFESKPAEQESQNNRRSSSASNQLGDHISEQPRVSTRKIPTYASSQHMAAAEKKGDRPVDNDSLDNRNIVLPPREQPATDVDSSSTSTQTCSPLASLKSKTSSQSSPDDAQQRDSHSLCTPPETLSHLRVEDRTTNGFVSGCDCSDDEIITVFRTRNGCRLQSSQSTFPMENPVAGTSGSNTALHSASTATAAKLYPSLKVENYDDSSASSFEELGAIGGTSDDSKTGADHSAQSSEPWQLVDREAMTYDVGEEELGKDVKGGLESSTATVMYTEKNPNVQSHRSVPKTTRTKKVTRRRSDGFLNRRRRRASDDESPTSPDSYTPVVPNIKDARTIFEVNETHNEREVENDVQGVNDGRRVEGARRFHCKRCGKNHLNIKRQVEKMRHDLENSHMTEADIKRELDEFLVYLEERTRSVDCSDSETTAASSVSGTRDTSSHILPPLNSPTQSFDENEGIHVYAAPSEFSAATTDSRFINLEDFGSLEELEQLCVKQLKEILMLNRVDYKGCCEKQELFERVVRLWKNLKSTPAIDKLQTDELCKICMDAPIECVILECGHMATCTGCGKVLSECPICRQYIVRVVRIFKA